MGLLEEARSLCESDIELVSDDVLERMNVLVTEMALDVNVMYQLVQDEMFRRKREKENERVKSNGAA